MRGNPHVRFGERIGRNHSEKSLYGALDPTSRDLRPSDADIELTKELIVSGHALQLPLEDHLIITEDYYCSIFSDEYLDFDP